jgi:type I protein arginine methyltransferase
LTAPAGYCVTSYGDMITCGPRMSAYAAALQRVITPGCSVLDLGAGTGILSLIACQLGAGSVVAVEPHDVISVAEQSAAANGYSDRIRFVQGLSSDLTLATRADVIVSDIRGVLPLFESHIPTIIDARTRLLAEGGVLVPRRDIIKVAVVEAPDEYRSCVQPWLINDYGLNLEAGNRFAVNQWRKSKIAPGSLVSSTETFAVLDYHTIADANVSKTVTLVATDDAVAHGLVLWFDADLSDGIGFSNAPSKPTLIYSQSFFPLEKPVALRKGDSIEVDLSAILVDDDYVWTWRTRIFSASSTQAHTSFSQSSFLSRVISPERLRQRTAAHIPPAGEAGALDAYCLRCFDGETSLGAIASKILDRFPGRFASQRAALRHVADLAERYGR